MALIETLRYDTSKKPVVQNLPGPAGMVGATPASSPTLKATNGYDFGVKKGLIAKGIDPNSIGWDPTRRVVTVDGRDFIKPSKIYNQTSFDTAANFNTAWDAYNKSLLQDRIVNPTIQQNPYTQQVDEAIKYLMNYSKNQQPIDPYSTPEYAAYAAQSGRRANEGIRAAQEALGSAGFGRSTALGERAQGIQNAENEYLTTQAIPQIIAAAQQRKQQEYNNLVSALEPLIGQQGRGDVLAQQERANVADALSYLTGRSDRAEDIAYRTARDTIADKRYQTEFDEDKRRFGLNYALDKAVRMNQISVNNAQLALETRNINSQIANRAADNTRVTPNKSGSSNVGPTTKGYSYKKDSNFIDDYKYVTSGDINQVEQDLINNRNELIDAYGIDGYNALLAEVNKRKPKKK